MLNPAEILHEIQHKFSGPGASPDFRGIVFVKTRFFFFLFITLEPRIE